MLFPIVVDSVLELVCCPDANHIFRKLVPRIYHPLRKEKFPKVQAFLQVFLEEFESMTSDTGVV